MEKENTKIFKQLLSELEDCDEYEQKQKVEEINYFLDEMDKEGFQSIFTEELFDKIDKMIEEKKMTMKILILLLKHVGSCKELKGAWIEGFENSLLCERFEKTIIEEKHKKEGKNEKLIVDLCECYLLQLDNNIGEDLVSICVPYLLKVALTKDKNEETLKEVEMALLALSHIDEYYDTPKELYLNEIKEIIQYHQENLNLTRLAYQSAWKFLICRIEPGKNLEGMIVNELHFARETGRELEELVKLVDWKRKKEEKGEKEEEEELDLLRWLRILETYFHLCKLWNDKNIVIINRITQVLRAAKDFSEKIVNDCISIFRTSTENNSMDIEFFVKGGAIDAILQEAVELNVIKVQKYCSVYFFKEICDRLKKKMDNKKEEPKQKEMKRKLFEKMEEEGYEDCIIGFFGCIKKAYYSWDFYQRLDDYFICY
ncbi:uncharacterized protein MONOS_17071 [Monocercomonoides exilis]|uniref:uncharacterized protein n=1 Tax=Monocercomonoides exilis TaxID=2049356 RepID=UPI00355A0560|nr:hypothetical protein MONOS_17071 [Monocercomonoides exilis]